MEINDKLILISGGESLKWEIEKCYRLRTKWVNYCGPIASKEYNWQCYFLEHKAPWMELNFYDYNGNISYKDAFDKYFSYLQLLSDAPQEQYNKFFQDIEEMKNESLRPDYCSLWNLFYEPQIWFNFIDVYPCNVRPWDSKLSVSNIFTILLNPKFTYKNLHVIPMEELKRYNETIKIIYNKIINWLILFKYSEDEINIYLNGKHHEFSDDECVYYKDIEKHIEEHYDKNAIIIHV